MAQHVRAAHAVENDGHPALKDNTMLDQRLLAKNTTLQQFASILPTGLAVLNHKAEAVHINKKFKELTAHEDTDKSFQSWFHHSIHPDDRDRVIDRYKDAFAKQRPLRIEFRAQGDGGLWRLLLLDPLKGDELCHAELTEFGGFICVVIDITDSKITELSQGKAVREAQIRKIQQERFVDMVSHEIRNPLSAVLHCSEDILEAIEASSTRMDSKLKSTLTEAAETIKLCVAHQKRIVDDVLNFSKLDASMLRLSPKAVQPDRHFANTLKIFQPELRKQLIDFDFKLDVSYEEMEVNWVNADLVRMSQVLINLMTNSIKFTADKEGTRKIIVGIGASRHRPTSYPPSVVFFSTEETEIGLDGTNTKAWGHGEVFYIMVAVSDTGIGIPDDTQKKLFQRFRQATPRTEQIYGGSGLGLNISRKLCHLHGGEIGVSSKEHEGSTFGFFFKTRRTALDTHQTEPRAENILSYNDLDYQLRQLGKVPTKPSITEPMPDSLLCPRVSNVNEVSCSNAKTQRKIHTSKLVEDIVEDEPASSRVDENPDSSCKPQSDQAYTDQLDSPSRNQRPSIKPKLNVLLAEDNVINARILRRKLEAHDFSVVVVANGRQAVDVYRATLQSSSFSSSSPSHHENTLQTHHPDQHPARQDSQDSQKPEDLQAPHHRAFDMILMDQEMPVMGGNLASGAIRRLEMNTAIHVPILGVSANARQEQKDDMIAAGMDDIISKPYAFADMLVKIQAMIDTNKNTSLPPAPAPAPAPEAVVGHNDEHIGTNDKYC